MSKEIICPECQAVMPEGSSFCDECGYTFKKPTPQPTTSAAPSGEIIGSGTRANITGGVTTTNTTHQNVNTSTVDQSSTVNNSTTIVMNGNKEEYCAVCGNPLEEKHPRCPKCGKGICPDCRVAGKNRCLECEKKAQSEYRTAFQQLLLTTNGNIGAGGRQLMDQKARELDVEDKKAAIENELSAAYKPAPKAVQPQVVPPAAPKAATHEEVKVAPKEVKVAEKGVHNVPPLMAPAPKTSTGTPAWVWIAVVAVVICGLAFFMGGGNDNAAPADDKNAQTETVEAPAATRPTPAVTTPAPAAPTPTTTAAPKAEPAPAPAPAPVQEVKPDANYEAGMEAYNAGKGMDAVKAFNNSGSADAYYMLGLIYEQGCGTVGKNAMLARKNFKKAAELGSAKAKAKL